MECSYRLPQLFVQLVATTIFLISNSKISLIRALPHAHRSIQGSSADQVKSHGIAIAEASMYHVSADSSYAINTSTPNRTTKTHFVHLQIDIDTFSTVQYTVAIVYNQTGRFIRILIPANL